MSRKITLLFLLAILLFSGCERKHKKPEHESTKTEQTTKETQESEAASTITLHTIDGNSILLTATPKGIIFGGYEGKVVLLDFFATWCPPCRAEMPHLVDIQNAYKGSVQIIGILMEENKEDLQLQQFAKKFHLNFPIANSDANFALADALGGIRSLPTMVMYDKNGDYFTHYVGAAPQEMIEADLNKAITK